MCQRFCPSESSTQQASGPSHVAFPSRTIRRGANFLNDAMSSMRCSVGLRPAPVLADGIPPRLTSSKHGAVGGSLLQRSQPGIHGGMTVVCTSQSFHGSGLCSRDPRRNQPQRTLASNRQRLTLQGTASGKTPSNGTKEPLS